MPFCRWSSNFTDSPNFLSLTFTLSLSHFNVTPSLLTGYRQRLGTLDSVPEHAIAPSPARHTNGSAMPSTSTHAHHGQQQLQVPDVLPSLRPRYLRRADGVPVQHHQEQTQTSTEKDAKENVEPRAVREPSQDSLKPPLPKKKKQEPMKHVKSSAEEKSVSGGHWSRGIAELTMASVGVNSTDPNRTGSSSTLTRGASNTRAPQTANSSMGNSRQTSSIGLDNSAQYSEDFESVSELDL